MATFDYDKIYIQFTCGMCKTKWNRNKNVAPTCYQWDTGKEVCPKCQCREPYYCCQEREKAPPVKVENDDRISVTLNDYSFLDYCRRSSICRFLYAISKVRSGGY